ncbi:MAG: lysophospholipase [Tannerellaceae bacterium]|nr:lysophospholipase [Tannerellaceae bacterium]
MTEKEKSQWQALFLYCDRLKVDGLRNIAIFCRGCLISLLLLVSLNQIKAQSPDVITENIRFDNAGVSLAGTIYTPRHSQAAVVLVHGSDQAPRMSAFASLLSEEGISVLTYDKRGVGESGGIYAGPEVGANNVDPDNLTLLAEDANAAVNILHQRDKNIPVGLVGFSQAGWIIPIAANKNVLVDFMVLFSGSMVPTLEQLRFQFFTEGKPDFWESHTEAEAREHIRSDADRYQFANTDPYDALSTLSIPGLWLFGGKDVQVPAGLSIDRLNALKAQGKPYEYCLFSTLGHNTAFSDSTEPVNIAVHWIKDRKHYMKSKTDNSRKERQNIPADAGLIKY